MTSILMSTKIPKEAIPDLSGGENSGLITQEAYGYPP